MLNLIIQCVCEVEDEDEAKAKLKAAEAVLSVYPFFEICALIHGQIQTNEKGGDH
jgi:hypothetical protein